MNLFLLAACVFFITVVCDNNSPEITLTPGNQQVKDGGIATFYCAARGDPSPIIQWKKNGRRISGTESRYQVKDVPGGGVLLRIEPIRAGRDNTTYECVAENGVGNAASAMATLTVFDVDKLPHGFPQITKSGVTNKVVELGHNTVLTCGDATGNPPPLTTWVRDLLPINTSDTRYSIGYDMPGALQIKNSEEKDQGQYECVAENPIGTEYSKAVMLYVKVRRIPPNFSVLPPRSIEVVLGADLNLTCVAVGSPMPFVKWRKSATQELTSKDKLPVGTNSLELTNIQESANYSCVASNTFGVVKTVTQVIVQSTESTCPRNVQVRPLSSSTIVIQWDEPAISNGEVTGYKIYYTTNPQLAMAQWQSQMVDNSGLTTISDLTPHIIYTIRVQAFTSVGPGPLSPPVNVKTQQGVPSQPSNLKALDIGETAVTLQWNKPTYSSEHIVNYELYWNDTYAKEKHHRRIPVSEEYTLTGLYPNTLYNVWLAARSQRGEGITTPPIPVRTKQYELGTCPRNVQVQRLSSSTMFMQWDEPVTSDVQVIGYKVFYTTDAQLATAQWESQLVDKTELAISDLTPNANYTIRVQALTAVGPPSPPLHVTSPQVVTCTLPVEGQSDNITVEANREAVSLNVTAHNITTHSLILSWSPPRNLNPIGYKISFDAIKEFVDHQGISQSTTFDKIEVALDHDVEFYVINQLTPFTTYNINVSAVTADYSYHPPSKITATTQMAAPKPMLKPDFYGVVNHEKIQVFLPQASEEYGPIDYYYLIVVPGDAVHQNPDEFLVDDIIDNQKKNSDDPTAPYIAAKFLQRNVPYTFYLGTGEDYNGFNNRQLQQEKKYRIFVRAVVAAPKQNLYTSSPFSEYLSLDMASVPSEEPS